MFDDTLNSSWDERSRRGLTALTSFGLQALAVGVLLILPLLRPTGLPTLRQLSTPVSLGEPLAPAPAVGTRANANTAAPVNPAQIVLRLPTQIPHEIRSSGDDAPSSGEAAGSYIPGISGAGSRDGVPVSLGSGPIPVLPVAPPPAAALVRLSHMREGDLIRKVLPLYPPLARAARIQGQVVLQAVISKQGAIENLKVVSGHPMLAPAAIDAVRQWLYRPYVLNSEPVEVETQITVNFSLAGN
jgi:periplasmic protein TonB